MGQPQRANLKHILIQSINAWGHLKPVLGIAAHIADARPEVIFTVLTSNIYHTKILGEIARVSKHADRFRVVDIQGVPADIYDLTTPEFNPVFAALWKRQSVMCKSTGETVPRLPRPTVVILDSSLNAAAEAVRAIAGKDCILAIFLAASAHQVFRTLWPGGLDDLHAEEDPHVAHKIRRRGKGKIVEIPGLPPVFDYEWHPQENDLPSSFLARDLRRFMLIADTALNATADALEEETLDALREWYASLGKTFWAVGPPNPPEATASNDVVAVSRRPDEEKVFSFLDRIYHSHGVHSLIFISFGTWAWPNDASRLWAIVEELLASKTPFLFAQPSPLTTVPPEYAAAIAASGSCMIVPWVPQDSVLAHSVVGWFLTHGGWNSTQEAVLAKVPMIFYPITADQPGNALLMTVKHQAAFELLSVRTGTGARRPYRCGDSEPEFSIQGVKRETRELLTRMKGQEGSRVRKKVEHLGDAYGRTWNDGSEAKRNLDGFLTKYVD